ncbi:hypothetical protein [Aurantiacibacter aquimixticola]|uniref:Uncharacterized protein n=1 Tax=Aurantiacibacter aquimixticola TaxID=1958945 RepID=A0A419RUA4_9SPHN|nr:hypothetical protein [Aurantiacibacter aquimixticola]RJY09366.1 hypothetical protein D6201_08360 [Aurantiacibacter aquimixticola]
MIAITQSPERAYALPVPGAAPSGQASLYAPSQRVSDAQRKSMLPTRDIWKERAVDWGSCEFARIGYPIGVGISAFQPIRMTCGDEDGLAPASLIGIARRAD